MRYSIMTDSTHVIFLKVLCLRQSPHINIIIRYLKWSTKTGHRVRVFSSIDFPIRLGVTHRYIRAVLVRCNIQRYSPLWRELPRWSLRNPPPASIRSSDSWRSVPLGCYPSSFRAGSYSVWSGIATITAGTACSYNDCPGRPSKSQAVIGILLIRLFWLRSNV